MGNDQAESVWVHKSSGRSQWVQTNAKVDDEFASIKAKLSPRKLDGNRR